MKIDPTKYQVFLFACPASLPLSFSVHPWFMVNKKGVVSRWEVTFFSRKRPTSWGYLNKNLYAPNEGIGIIPFFQTFCWKTEQLAIIEGGANSLAHRMSIFIEETPRIYPSCFNYSLRGPNSNTYVEWVIDAFPESGFHLPANAIGKEYAKRLPKPTEVVSSSDYEVRVDKKPIGSDIIEA